MQMETKTIYVYDHHLSNRMSCMHAVAVAELNNCPVLDVCLLILPLLWNACEFKLAGQLTVANRTTTTTTTIIVYWYGTGWLSFAGDKKIKCSTSQIHTHTHTHRQHTMHDWWHLQSYNYVILFCEITQVNGSFSTLFLQWCKFAACFCACLIISLQFVSAAMCFFLCDN